MLRHMVGCRVLRHMVGCRVLRHMVGCRVLRHMVGCRVLRHMVGCRVLRHMVGCRVLRHMVGCRVLRHMVGCRVLRHMVGCRVLRHMVGCSVDKMNLSTIEHSMELEKNIGLAGCLITQLILAYFNMVTVPHKLVRLAGTLDYSGVGLQTFRSSCLLCTVSSTITHLVGIPGHLQM